MDDLYNLFFGEKGNFITNEEGRVIFVGGPGAGGGSTVAQPSSTVEQKPFPISKGELDETRLREARKQYMDSKGTNPANNRELIEAAGVGLSAPVELQAQAEEALAHVVSDTYLARQLAGKEVIFKELENLHGTSRQNRLYADSGDLRKLGAGFGATIIRHELEHSIQSALGSRAGNQESTVRYKAGFWALHEKAAFLAKTNPVAYKGFVLAAKEQGVK